MSFPAEVAFEADKRITQDLWTLWRWALKNFHASKPRTRKGATIALETGIERARVYGALDDLCAFGYLTEHPRGVGNSRWFTVNWEVDVPQHIAA